MKPLSPHMHFASRSDFGDLPPDDLLAAEWQS